MMVCNLHHLQRLFPKSNGTKFQCISSTGRVVSNYQNLSNKLYFPTRHFKHTQRAFFWLEVAALTLKQANMALMKFHKLHGRQASSS